jgi:hypothetical protein
MKRRDFIIVVGVAAALRPFAARAQPLSVGFDLVVKRPSASEARAESLDVASGLPEQAISAIALSMLAHTLSPIRRRGFPSVARRWCPEPFDRREGRSSAPTPPSDQAPPPGQCARNLLEPYLIRMR